MNNILTVALALAGGFLVYETGKVMGGVQLLNRFHQNPSLLTSFGLTAGCTPTAAPKKKIIKKKKK